MKKIIKKRSIAYEKINYTDFKMIKNIIKEYYKDNYHCIEEDNSLEVDLNYEEEELINRQNELFKIINNDCSIIDNTLKNFLIGSISSIISLLIARLVETDIFFNAIKNIPSFIIYIIVIFISSAICMLIFYLANKSISIMFYKGKYEIDLYKYEFEFINKILEKNSEKY